MEDISMDFELLTLGFLNSSPKTGYRMQQIAGNMMLNFSISMNQIYPTLRKFEEQGFVKKETVVQEGRPNKNVYAITETGREYFLKRITAPHEPFDYVLDFLVRVLFFRFLSREQVFKEFEEEINSLQEQIDNLETMEDTVNARADRYGEFCYRTALQMLRTLRGCYIAEQDRMKTESSEGQKK
jgi:DNA-binding PadR family transcriptional regulator